MISKGYSIWKTCISKGKSVSVELRLPGEEKRDVRRIENSLLLSETGNKGRDSNKHHQDSICGQNDSDGTSPPAALSKG
jgi:hypothetical protein